MCPKITVTPDGRKPIQKMKHVNINSSNGRTKFIGEHCRGHDDEYFGTWQMRFFGERMFPGVSSATLVFLRREFTKPQPGFMYIGVGGGEFDEHRADGRLPDTCAARLVAERLGIQDMPGIKELLAEVQYIDCFGNATPSQLASLITAMHRVNGGDKQLETYRFAGVAYHAIVYGRHDKSFDLRQAWEQYRAANRIPKSDRAAATVNTLIHQAFVRRNSRLTELAAIASKMDKEILWSWLDDAFTTLVRDAGIYIRAFEEVTTGIGSEDIETEGGLEPFGMLQTDNEMVNRAAFSDAGGKPGVFVVRRSTGHIQVFGNKHRGMELSDFAAMVRMAEYKVRTGRTLAFEEARGLGTKELCPVWHQPQEFGLFNASLTHPGIEPSVLSLADMRDIAIHAFKGALRQAWLDRYFQIPVEEADIEKAARRMRIDPTAEIDLDDILDEATKRSHR